MRSILLIALSVFIFLPNVFADQAIQIDWSGGPNVYGPVYDWGNEFWTSSDVNWSTSLTLAKAFTKVDICCYDGSASVCSWDIDGDGDQDVVSTAYDAGVVAWFENTDGSGSDWAEHLIAMLFTNAVCACVQDINGDGYPDVIGAAQSLDEIRWWQHSGTVPITWTEHVVDTFFNQAWSVHSVDVDGDGDNDILGAAMASNQIVWYENEDGSGTAWGKHVIQSFFDCAWSVWAADVDGDGDFDVLGTARMGNEIAWWENVDGTGLVWDEHMIDGDYYGAEYVCCADIDGDGYLDILGVAADANEVTWWENTDGTGLNLVEHVIDDDFVGPHCVYHGDFDGDGDIDVVGAGYESNQIVWWENTDGQGSAWQEYILTTEYGGARAVYSSDINDDDRVDILGAARLGNDVSWWENLGLYQGSLTSSILNTACEPIWGNIEWSASAPSGTSICFLVRASETYTDMGAWSDTITSQGSLSGILEDGNRYLQYQAVLLSEHPGLTPGLNSVTVSWNPMEIGNDPTVTEYFLYGVEPNPTHGAVSIRFAVPELSSVEMVVSDLTGRIVSQVEFGEASPGIHEKFMGNLVPGVYFCRMVSGEFTATQRFVVIE